MVAFMKTKIYAGIGSRKTPPEILTKFQAVATLLENRGYTLRSGGAEGADSAFEAGVRQPNMKEILRPRDAHDMSRALASQIHPAWDQCNDYARDLHGRNVQIILGKDLHEPVMFVIAYTENPEFGGTRTGLEVAKRRQIPIFNFFSPIDEAEFFRYYQEKL
jgi:hypothetical protein